MSAQPMEETKRCWRCKRWLPLSAFHKDVARIDGVQGACRECRSEVNRIAWRTGHPDPRTVYFRGDVRWDIDRLIARIEAANAADLANGGSAFTTRRASE